MTGEWLRVDPLHGEAGEAERREAERRESERREAERRGASRMGRRSGGEGWWIMKG